jgi:pyrroloquinoline quinone biosynthesis protein D
MQWEEAQQTYVLLYPEGMVKLNPSASEILKYCDGSRTTADILDELSSRFPDADLKTDVIDFLEVARNRGWIRDD